MPRRTQSIFGAAVNFLLAVQVFFSPGLTVRWVCAESMTVAVGVVKKTVMV